MEYLLHLRDKLVDGMELLDSGSASVHIHLEIFHPAIPNISSPSLLVTRNVS